MKDYNDIIIGTTSMISISMCIVVILFVAMAIKHKQYSVRNIFKDALIFTGILFTLQSVAFQLFFIQHMEAKNFHELEISILTIYNGFFRMVGISFIFIWLIFFKVIGSVGESIDHLINKQTV